MNIPTQMARQTANRMSLIEDLRKNGLIATPIEHLKTPALLAQNLSDYELMDMYKYLNKTRKKRISFSLNGRLFLPTRKQALDLVKLEIKLREKK
jgi:hypothetical protein